MQDPNPEQSLSDSHVALLRFRAGDPSAMWRVAESLRPYLKSIAVRELATSRRSSSEDDSDLVQRTLTSAVESMSEFRGQTLEEWRAWLATIARNEARASRRFWAASRRSLSQENVAPSGVHPVSGGDSPSQAARRSELGTRLQAVLRQLSPEHQQLIAWRHDEELTHAEIAARLGIREEAARQRCKAAMDALRKRWAGNDLTNPPSR